MTRQSAIRCLLTFLLTACGLGGAARAQSNVPAGVGEPPARPLLRIEAGMHTNKIGRIGVDAAGRYLVTGSHDKTIRVWSLADGTLLRVLRPPIGTSVEGAVYSVAISPDGVTVASGGLSDFAHDGANDIYLFDRATGAMTRRIRDLPNIVDCMSFSQDGRYLAAGLLGKSGIGVFSVRDGVLGRVDAEYANDCYGLDWDSTGRLVTSCWDGFIRLYSATPELKLIAKVKAPGGARPYGIRFSPDGARIVVGYSDTNAVSVLSGANLAMLFKPMVTGVRSDDDLSTVCWSNDGKKLYAAGTASDSARHNFIRAWSDDGAFRDSVVAYNTIFALHALPAVGPDSGSLVYVSGEPTWGEIDRNGVKTAIGDPSTVADYRRNIDGFKTNADGSVLKFAFEAYGKQPALLSIQERTVSLFGSAPESAKSTASEKLMSALLQPAGLTIAGADAYHPTLNGVRIPLDDDEQVTGAFAFTPDRKSFLLGTEFNLMCFGIDLKPKWTAPTTSTIWGVNVTANGEVGLAAYADGTIRWFRMRDGKELLDFFPHKDKKRWVLWTPDGYYDCSPGGEDLIGWNLNHGRDRAADFYPASRFRDEFYRPDVIAQVLKTLDPAEALRIANAAAGRSKTAASASVETHLPPIVTIVSPADLSSATGGSVTIRYTVRSPDGSPVTGVRALVDGRPAEEARGLDFTAAGAQGHQNGPANGSASDIRQIIVPVPPRDCEVEILADNRNAPSVPATLRLKAGVSPIPVVTGGAPAAANTEFVAKPKLYVLAVGIGKYADTRDVPPLTFPAKDAADVAAALKAQAGGLYSSVEVRLLTDANATHDDVIKGLTWIRRQTTSRDVAIVFLAGHGDNDPDGDYCFLPQNFDPTSWETTAVPNSDIQKSLRNIAGKALFFIDTCHSGGVDAVNGVHLRGAAPDMNRMVNELSSAENGVVVFAASTGRQFALEKAAWGNGAFTKALVEGLTGKADYQHTGRITVNMLDLYLSERVKELTDGRQTPTTTKPQTVPDFPVATVL